ncbi:hypothetical protein [Rubellimicrobium roseum]|uniref:Uncharacterized protein n=1 Tax=Rubellimicrobium roseum TaxID=687525 RepID=A0A5C4N3D5_9RHOB|nr:hypothetical protein [Rubellimicrobium roseum]TNC60036.1 hypothetical protein FHG71_22385 [Rubellimicrobium roseum]
MGRIATVALCATLAGAGAARAENAFDLIFRSGTLDGLPQGTELSYDAGPAGTAEWERVVVGLGPQDAALVEGRTAEEPARNLGRYRAAIGNPVVMVFLESTVQDIAEQTGGSPYYIRNRMRDALAGTGAVEAVTVPWEGGSVAATEVALTPFAGDPNRAALGGFADLEIRVVVSEAVPGWYHSMSVEAPAAGAREAYAASLALAEVGP